MRKIREILRLYHELKLGKKQIAKICSMSPSTVVEYVRKAETAGLKWPLPEDLDDTAVEALLFSIEPLRLTDRPLPVMAERGWGWKPPYDRDFMKATDKLQLPNIPTDVIRIEVPWNKLVRGPGMVHGNPGWGKGGGFEYYRGRKWPKNYKGL